MNVWLHHRETKNARNVSQECGLHSWGAKEVKNVAEGIQSKPKVHSPVSFHPDSRFFSSGLVEQSGDRKEQTLYVRSGWLERIANGVYKLEGAFHRFMEYGKRSISPGPAAPSSECQLIINEYIRTLPLVEPSQRSSLISLNIKTLHTTLWISTSGIQSISDQPIRHISIAESSQRQYIKSLIHRAMRITSHFWEEEGLAWKSSSKKCRKSDNITIFITFLPIWRGTDLLMKVFVRNVFY